MSTNTMYALSIEEIANAIAIQVPLPPEDKTTIIVEGEMGSGKSSILKTLAEDLPNHKAIYFDCTTKADAGDLMLPKFKDLEGNDYVSFATNEELGMHLKDTPLAIMVDEVGKNRAIHNPLNRLFQERMIGMHELHPESVVFATTNLGFENVGDAFLPHTCNRVTFVRMRKPSAVEWIEWGINHNLDHVTLAWVKDNPQVLDASDDVKDPEDNVYINHPKAQGRRSFCTARSLHKASNYMKMRDKLNDKSLTALLIGTIGMRGGMDLMAHLKLADQLPSLESIKSDPKNAKVPTTGAGICMVVYRTLASIEQDWLNAWLDYMVRLDIDAQGMFANGVRAPRYGKQAMVMQNRKFTQWAADNSHMFSSDQ